MGHLALCQYFANMPIHFKYRLNCSSHEAWFACLRQDDCVSISQNTSGSSACPICIRNGTVSPEMRHLRLSSSLIGGQASNLKCSSTYPLRDELLIFETHYTANYHNIHKESEMGHPWDQKWDTFFSAVAGAIDFKRRLKCTRLSS